MMCGCMDIFKRMFNKIVYTLYLDSNDVWFAGEILKLKSFNMKTIRCVFFLLTPPPPQK